MMDHEQENFEPSDEFMRAWDAIGHPTDNPEPKTNRAAVEAVLARFAAGGTDEEDLWIMQRMASALLAAGGREASAEKTPAKRADAVLRASGLSGRYDDRAEVRREMQVLVGLGDIDADGNTSAPYTLAQAIRAAIARGDYPDTMSETEIRRDIMRHRR